MPKGENDDQVALFVETVKPDITRPAEPDHEFPQVGVGGEGPSKERAMLKGEQSLGDDCARSGGRTIILRQ